MAGTRPVIDLDRAVGFVRTRGSAIEQARLAAILWGGKPDKSVLEQIATLQRDDGGFACWTKEFSSVCDTVYVLTWLDDLGIRTGAMVDRAFGCLIERQLPDGGWDEVEQLRTVEHPPFLEPGKESTRVWLSAYCGHWFVRFGRAGPPEAKACPVRYLEARVQAEGLLAGGQLRATWDALVLFHHHPGPESDLFRRTLGAIRREFSPEKWEGNYLAWLGCCLRDAGLAAAHPLVRRCVSELCSKQRPDGSWDSEDGEPHAADATVQVLRVLRHYRAV